MAQNSINFPTNYNEILSRISAIQPKDYGKSRNFIDGAVTYLSPYISRGVISTKQVMQNVLDRGFAPNAIEKLIQELAWRDYWQQIWIAKQEAINFDLKNEQSPVNNQEIAKAIVHTSTGITAIDNGISEFYKTGYLHNHLRMHIASVACNLAQSHWKHPAQWMYYHLLDGDWASNSLSWQWVAGANSNKKYYANQENINKYCHTNQRNTFLDVPYEDFSVLEIPAVLKETTIANLTTALPAKNSINLTTDKATCIYNYYNLDPNWHKNDDVNRILLLEPSIFAAYPIGPKAVDFMLALSHNIPDIKVFVGEFKELVEDYHLKTIFFKEHPLNKNYKGIEEPRDWMFRVKGYYPSFFGFWKKCQKELRY
jgi:deoxyribodipyrimidine photo-lyase